MPASIGVNLRVTGHCSQGGRKYMEDFFSVAYQQTEDEKDLEYAFFGIYDGHGGGEAATYAKEHLMESIVRQKSFWSDKDEDVLRAIKEGYIATHYAMWKEQANWPKTASGLPSTAGTTATIAFIRHAKIYIGHVGDSGVILGYQEPGDPNWKSKQLTKDHKPENAAEMYRIQQCGGKVVTKSGVPRVVWNRPRIGHKGPVRRSTPIDEIPFLAVARSLGDLWSYNSACDQFVVSPDPDTCVIAIDTNTFRCLIFGTDGLWNMMSPETAVQIVQTTEKHNECIVFSSNNKQKIWINPSKSLVEHSLERWSTTRMRADNTTAVTLLLDPPGPPRAEVLKNQRKESMEATTLNNNPIDTHDNSDNVDNKTYPTNGLAIVTRYPINPYLAPPSPLERSPNQTGDAQFLNSNIKHSTPISSPCPTNHAVNGAVNPNQSVIETTPTSSDIQPKTDKESKPNMESVPDKNNTPSTSSNKEHSENIQINEVSSSSPEILDTSEEKSIDNIKERYQKLNKLIKSKSNFVLSGRCTRSHDLGLDKRVRAVSSSSDYFNQNGSENRRKLRIYRKHHLRDSLRRNTRAMVKSISDDSSTVKVKNKFVINERCTRRRTIPINDPDQKPDKKSDHCIPKESEPSSYSSLYLLSSRKTRSNQDHNDIEISDQENKSLQRLSRGKSFIHSVDKSPRLLRTRLDVKKPMETRASCSLTRNLRERNVITVANPQTNVSSSKSKDVVVVTVKNRSKNYTKKRMIPTKNTKVQTRNNRFKKCNK